MQVPELYVHEVIFLVNCVDSEAKKISQRFHSDHRLKRIKMFFMPWRRRDIEASVQQDASSSIYFLELMQELRNKLISSTGRDNDMQPITLEEILKSKRNESNNG